MIFHNYLLFCGDLILRISRKFHELLITYGSKFIATRVCRVFVILSQFCGACGDVSVGKVIKFFVI